MKFSCFLPLPNGCGSTVALSKMAVISKSRPQSPFWDDPLVPQCLVGPSKQLCNMVCPDSQFWCHNATFHLNPHMQQGERSDLDRSCATFMMVIRSAFLVISNMFL